jgi:hypothetical protein
VESLKTNYIQRCYGTTRRKRKILKKTGIPGWKECIQGIIGGKKAEHLKYLQLNNEENPGSYKVCCVAVRRETTRIYRES